ncbi:hypothetical protein [Methylobacterium sp. D48H]
MSMSGLCQNAVYPAIEKPTHFSDKNEAILVGSGPASSLRRENHRFADFSLALGEMFQYGISVVNVYD